MGVRPISRIPKSILCVLGGCLLMQVLVHFSLAGRVAKFDKLSSPPPVALLQISSFGDPISSAKVLALYLQAFDQQAGVRVGFRQLDYAVVQAWMQGILELDPRGQYPLLLASRVYGEVSNQGQQRQMLDFVYRQFYKDPNRRWPWLAHAAVLAKHRLHDLPLARQYAQAIRLHAKGNDVPHWASQMEIFLLDDLSETASAKILLGALLASGTISDQHELAFLKHRLQEFEAKLGAEEKK